MNYAKNIHLNAQNIANMIDHSYSLFKMEEGTFLIQSVKINIIPILEKTLDLYSNLFNCKNISYKLNINADESIFTDEININGEAVYIETLFSNLILTAIETSPENSKISIDINHTESTIEIDIHNNGIIPEEQRDRFFAKTNRNGEISFFNLENYVSRLIVQAHKGKIALMSGKDLGTHFIIKFPLKN